MIAVIAKLNVTQGKEAEFETVMLNLAAQVRANESGNQLYTLCKDNDGKYLVLELYETEEDLAAHGETEHLKASGPSFKGLMAGAPEIERLQVIG
jgi:quinol monooxygenase YgiN